MGIVKNIFETKTYNRKSDNSELKVKKISLIDEQGIEINFTGWDEKSDLIQNLEDTKSIFASNLNNYCIILLKNINLKNSNEWGKQMDSTNNTDIKIINENEFESQSCSNK